MTPVYLHHATVISYGACMMQAQGGSSGLTSARYVRLTTLRRNGTPVATPVWQITDGDTMWVWTGATTGKARRLGNNPALTLAPCTARGQVIGDAVDARGQVMSAGDAPEVFTALRRKYGWQMTAMLAFHWFEHRVLRKPRVQYVLLRIGLPARVDAEGDRRRTEIR
jgi:PPOX class probable F420-dependent enzyme